MRRWLWDQYVDIVWSEEFDNGGMFDWEEGVCRTEDGKYRAFVKTGWGGGGRSKGFDTVAEARADIERLRDKC